MARSTRVGERDVRIPAVPEVAALAGDGQPLRPVAAPAAGLRDQEERPAAAAPRRLACNAGPEMTQQDWCFSVLRGSRPLEPERDEGEPERARALPRMTSR